MVSYRGHAVNNYIRLTYNQFFFEYGRLTNQLERTDYQRQHRKTVVKQGKCCFKVPKVDRNGSIDPGAILWRQQHNDDEPCEKCPSCTLFTSLSILYKLCSHVALLQAKSQPDQCVPGTRQRIEAEEELARVRQFIPAHLASQLPGGYFRESGIMDDHFALSGKMVVLDKLLRSIHAQHGRVLLFATSTKALDLIEKHIVAMGFSHMRMDGQTSQKKRTEIADTFKSNSQILVFLLSTKAMGVGLNLTEANFVIIFDVDWNPANDCQAQGS